MIIKENYFLGVILFFGTFFAMDNQKKESDILPKVLALPPDLVQKIGLFTLEDNPLITFLYEQKLELLSENHQDLNTKNDQLASYVQKDNHGKWQHIENGYPHLQLSFEKYPKEETDWLYDGPNKKNTILVAAIARKEKLSSSQEETSTLEHTSLFYQFPYQPVDKFVRLTKQLPLANTTALAIAYNTNHRAIAIRSADHSIIVLYDHQGIEVKREIIEQCFIKRLLILSYGVVYALSEQGDMYAVDYMPDKKAILQIFKDTKGTPIKIEDFAIDMKYRVQGALISNKKFYLANIARKKFREIPIPNLNIEDAGLCQLKAFDDKVGIFMRHFNQYTICVMNVARMALEKIHAR